MTFFSICIKLKFRRGKYKKRKFRKQTLRFAKCITNVSFSSGLAFNTDEYKPFLNNPWCLSVCRTCLLKTLWEKEKLLVTSNFSFSHSVFYLCGELSAIFNKFEIVVCKLFQFDSPKFVIWERVKCCSPGKKKRFSCLFFHS